MPSRPPTPLNLTQLPTGHGERQGQGLSEVTDPAPLPSATSTGEPNGSLSLSSPSHHLPSHHHRDIEDDAPGPGLSEVTDPPPLPPSSDLERASSPPQPPPPKSSSSVSHTITILSHLTLFSLLGTLSRLALSRLTTYPSAPITFPVLWSNAAASLVMGFLSELASLHPIPSTSSSHPRESSHPPTLSTSAHPPPATSASAHPPPAASASPHPPSTIPASSQSPLKQTPLYIALTTGYAGSFSSFSAFMRDTFLSLSNDPLPTSPLPPPRPRGDSFLAPTAIILTTTALSLSALLLGSHLARFLPPTLQHRLTLPFRSALTARPLAPLFLAVIAYTIVLLLSFARGFGTESRGERERWRGSPLFALLLSPPGCVLRFYLGKNLNGRWGGRFPLGTFVANMLATAVLGGAWDGAHVRGATAGVLGMENQRRVEVLRGMQDGLCGCLSTVSTWVFELEALGKMSARRGQGRGGTMGTGTGAGRYGGRDEGAWRGLWAWVYGGASVGVGLGLLVGIMGGVRWSEGFSY